MSSIPIPKYAQLEVERRWLVPNSSLPQLADAPVRRIDDLYLHGGHIRIRVVSEPNGRRLFKLGKKYPSPATCAAPVVSVYLTEEEAAPLRSLPGRSSQKHRYAVHGGSLDVYVQPKYRFAIFEVELAAVGEAVAYSPPAFVGEEVTGNAAYTGFALAAG